MMTAIKAVIRTTEIDIIALRKFRVSGTFIRSLIGRAIDYGEAMVASTSPVDSLKFSFSFIPLYK